jgi:hypothetical protein
MTECSLAKVVKTCNSELIRKANLKNILLYENPQLFLHFHKKLKRIKTNSFKNLAIL